MPIIAPDIAIDLGTSNTQVYVKHKGVVLDEPTLMVVDNKKKKSVKAFGDDARLLLGRTHGDVVSLRPLEEGVIKDYDMTEYMLEYFIRKSIGSSRLVRPRGLITVPTRITAVERKVICEAAERAGVRRGALHLIDKPFASALGSGLPVFDPKGSMVVDIGGGTTEVAVIAMGGIVVSQSIRVGGLTMDRAIIDYIKRVFNMQIGDRTAEDVKMDLGSALPINETRRAFVRGHDQVTKLPQTAEISAKMVYEALIPPCQEILAAIQYVLERTPPELAGDVMRSGIHLTGGASQLCAMDRFIATELDMPVLLAKEAMACTIKGIGYLVDNIDLMQRMCTPVAMRSSES
ncbi:MAG: rod shape-determining protein [Clostridia bacterium]|nr:rod shape-determining protein [Clostridia bacterium]